MIYGLGKWGSMDHPPLANNRNAMNWTAPASVRNGRLLPGGRPRDCVRFGVVQLPENIRAWSRYRHHECAGFRCKLRSVVPMRSSRIAHALPFTSENRDADKLTSSHPRPLQALPARSRRSNYSESGHLTSVVTHAATLATRRPPPRS